MTKPKTNGKPTMSDMTSRLLAGIQPETAITRLVATSTDMGTALALIQSLAQITVQANHIPAIAIVAPTIAKFDIEQHADVQTYLRRLGAQALFFGSFEGDMHTGAGAIRVLTDLETAAKANPSHASLYRTVFFGITTVLPDVVTQGQSQPLTTKISDLAKLLQVTEPELTTVLAFVETLDGADAPATGNAEELPKGGFLADTPTQEQGADWQAQHPSLASGQNPAPDSAEAKRAAATEQAAYGSN